MSTCLLYQWVACFCLLLFSCNPEAPEDPILSFTNPDIEYTFPYDLDQPAKDWKLPEELDEVSGITLHEDQVMACVQDEKALIYLFDLKEKKVVHTVDFGKDGDYEALTKMQDTFFVLRSDGTLFEITEISGKKAEASKIKTSMGAKNDTEGLCYDPAAHRLLIALKGESAEADAKDRIKSIYQFDLDTRQFIDSAVINIDVKEIKSAIKEKSSKKFYKKVRDHFDDDQKDKLFQPSEIAIQPQSKNIYITSAVGSLLMILTPEGNFLHLERLDKNELPQPEGMTFDANGDLYISTEADSKKARIFKYELNNQSD